MKCFLFFIAGLIGSIAAQSWMDARWVERTAPGEALYLRFGETLKIASIGFDGLLADLYWIRTVEYFGEKLEQQRKTADALDFGQMPLLEPLLNITTELDPHHVAAYRFGGFFLRFLDPAKALRFLQIGIRNNSAEWRLYQDLGYLYWREGRFREAAEAYNAGGDLAGAPVWMKAMAASMHSRGGDREMAREMFRRLCEGNDDPFIRGICEEQIQK